MPRSRRPQRCDDLEFDRAYIPFRTVIDLHGMKANRVLLLRGALVWMFVVAGAANAAQAQVFAPAPSQVGPPLLPAPPHAPMQIPALKPSAPAFPNCRDAPAVECRRAHQNSRHRRLRKANGRRTRPTAVIQKSYLRLSETVPTTEQNGESRAEGWIPAGAPPAGGTRETREKRESLKTLPPNCCATIHAEAG